VAEKKVAGWSNILFRQLKTSVKRRRSPSFDQLGRIKSKEEQQKEFGSRAGLVASTR